MADERVNRKNGKSRVCKGGAREVGEERKFMNLLSLLSWLWPILSDSSGRAPQ